VTKAAASDRRDVGFVTPNFYDGCLFVRNEDGKYFRLQWNSPKKSKADGKTKQDMRRALPAGKYTLTGYRLERHDDQGRAWFVSSTSGHGIRKFEIRAGESQRITVPHAITFNCRTRVKDTGVQVMMGIQGAPHAGLSIYCDGRRIPIRYLVSSGDKVLADGVMKYG
jgi:hypothetical protein